ncbi:MAG: DUF2274 domain-containing protein [Pseudomonadota bacterium]
MTDLKLKVGPIPDQTPVKLALSLDPALHEDLQAYANVYQRAYGDKAPLAALIPHMLGAFLAGDTGFRKARRTQSGQAGG